MHARCNIKLLVQQHAAEACARAPRPLKCVLVFLLCNAIVFIVALVSFTLPNGTCSYNTQSQTLLTAAGWVVVSVCLTIPLRIALYQHDALFLALSWLALGAASRFVHPIALPPANTVGNFFSDYASHVGYASSMGRWTLFTLPYALLTTNFLQHLPQAVPPVPRPAPPHRGAAHVCPYSHEILDSGMWRTVPAMHGIIRALVGEEITHVKARFPGTLCAIHLRLDDNLVIRDPQYPLLRYSWFKKHLQKAPRACDNIVIASNSPRLRPGSNAMRASTAIQRAFVAALRRDFPAAAVSASLNGTVLQDFALLAGSTLMLGSPSTFSLWAGVAAEGDAYLPRCVLLVGGYPMTLAHPGGQLRLVSGQFVANEHVHKMVSEGNIDTLLGRIFAE